MTPGKIVNLFKSGKSYTEIGKLCGKTKGQIAGIIYRYRRRKDDIPIKERRVIKTASVKPIFADNVVSIVSLKETTGCKYPYGTGPYTFCNKDIYLGAYCKEHRDLCVRIVEKSVY